MTQTPPGPPSLSAPPGWYSDPYYPHLPSLRYWDGLRWTAHAAYAVSPSKPPPVTPDGQPLAGFWQRVLAYLLDIVILSVLQLSFTWSWFVSYLGELTDQMRANFNELQANPDAQISPFPFTQEMLANMLKIALVAIVLAVVYHAVFLRWKQATPGKLIVGLRVRLRERPGRLPWSTIGLRLLGQFWPVLLIWIPFVGSFLGLYTYVDDLWPLGDDKRQALHDKIAKTNVVKARP